MKLSSHNEWDRLKAVIVGTIDGFSPGLEMPLERASVLAAARDIAQRAYPDWYRQEVAEDLDNLCAIFRAAGVTVVRPEWTETTDSFQTPNWAAAGCDLYNVRDLHLVVGQALIVSAPAARFRMFENLAFRDLFYKHFFDEGFRWLVAPSPRLRGDYLRELDRPATILEAAEDTQHRKLSHGLAETFHRLDECEIIFDAANTIRLGVDLLYLVSSTGNRKGAAWLQSALGPDYAVHVTHAYRSSHLDSTILPLREGTVLLNAARVAKDTCPEILKSWDKMYFSDVAPVDPVEIEFHNTVRLPAYAELRQLGVNSSLNHISSAWAGLNLMSLDANTVLVHDRQTDLIRALERKGFTIVPVRMRHCYTMLGGLHCATLDVTRVPAHA